MFIVLLFVGSGIYLMLMAFGLVQKAWWERIDPYTRPNVRLAIGIFAVGLLGISIYHIHMYNQFRASLTNQPQTVQPGSQSRLPGGPVRP